MDTYLFINLCPEALTHPKFDLDLPLIIADFFGFPKEKIIFEITEKSFPTDCDYIFKNIINLKESGFKIAMDDFGAGCGSPKFANLLEPEIIKIDQYFLRTYEESSFTRAFVDFIISICKELDILTVAEGIEKEEELHTFINLGVDLLQGFYLGKPEEGLRRSFYEVAFI